MTASGIEPATFRLVEHYIDLLQYNIVGRFSVCVVYYVWICFRKFFTLMLVVFLSHISTEKNVLHGLLIDSVTLLNIARIST